MRLLIIILVLVGLSFVAVMSYGLIRDPAPAPAGAGSGSCASAPRMDGDELDEDAAEDWCSDPPALVTALTWSPEQPVVLDRPLKVPSDGGDVCNPLPTLGLKEICKNTPAATPRRFGPSGEKQIARFRWVAGGPVLISHVRDRKPQRLCLCQPGARLDRDALDACRPKWVARLREQDGHLLCGARDGEGTIALPAQGSQLRFQALAGSATVEQAD